MFYPGHCLSDLTVARVKGYKGYCIVRKDDPTYVVQDGFDEEADAHNYIWETYDDCD